MKKGEVLDVLKLRQSIQDDVSLKKFLVRPSTISNLISASTLETISVFTDNNVLDAMFLLISFYNAARILNNWSVYRDVDFKLWLMLEETPIYRRLSEHYFTFIHEVAKFAKQFGLKDSKEVICLFELMMENGYFSEDSHHEYHKYKYEYTEMSGTIGAQVITGRCVCRHMSSIFCDLLYQMNISACNTVVKIKYDNELEEFIKQGRKREFTHSVISVFDGQTKYLYDPTHATFAGKCDFHLKSYLALKLGLERALKKNYEISEIALGNVRGNDGYYMISSQGRNMNKLHWESFKQRSKYALEHIDPNEIYEIRKKVEQIYINNYDMFDKFYFDFTSLLQEIAADVRMLMPKSDEEIKEWVLKY